MNDLELTGRAATHVRDLEESACALHAHAISPFRSLQRAAQGAGIAVKPVSAFRGFDRQLAIWNAKYRGERPLLDRTGRPLESAALSPDERVTAILQWSALPGASRHHWGTDVDLIDANAVPENYSVQLSVAEFSAAGPFAALARWMDSHAARFGFFRPFRGIWSGVQPEPWHFSFAPVAESGRRKLSVELLYGVIEAAPLLGKTEVLRRLPEIHAHYVAAIDVP
ncbi:MAG: M15 family metallopeptidase [Steroidobacteraceae bacterium]